MTRLSSLNPWTMWDGLPMWLRQLLEGVWLGALFVIGLALWWPWETAEIKAEPTLPVVTEPVTPPAAVRPTLGQRVEPYLERVNAQHAQALETAIAGIQRFFESARQQAPVFAAEALSWRSTWASLLDTVPWTAGDRLPQRLQTLFAEHVFSPAQLQAELERVVQQFQEELRDIDQQLLVELRLDLEAEYPEFPWEAFSAQAWASAQAQAVEHLWQLGQPLVQGELATQAVSLLSAELALLVGTRLATSSGGVAVGAATSWSHLGVGLVVGVLVDQMLTRLWHWWADPAGTLSGELCRELDDLEQQVLGTGVTPGLQQALQTFVQYRSHQQRRWLEGAEITATERVLCP